jgi:hypothetical protein
MSIAIDSGPVIEETFYYDEESVDNNLERQWHMIPVGQAERILSMTYGRASAPLVDAMHQYSANQAKSDASEMLVTGSMYMLADAAPVLLDQIQKHCEYRGTSTHYLSLWKGWKQHDMRNGFYTNHTRYGGFPEMAAQQRHDPYTSITGRVYRPLTSDNTTQFGSGAKKTTGLKLKPLRTVPEDASQHGFAPKHVVLKLQYSWLPRQKQ